jgi:hypothetical protein
VSGIGSRGTISCAGASSGALSGSGDIAALPRLNMNSRHLIQLPRRRQPNTGQILDFVRCYPNSGQNVAMPRLSADETSARLNLHAIDRGGGNAQNGKYKEHDGRAACRNDTSKASGISRLCDIVR